MTATNPFMGDDGLFHLGPFVMPTRETLPALERNWAARHAQFPLAAARRVADELLCALAPYCERAEVAGSVRRGKEIVKDIEICAVPRVIERPTQVGLVEVMQSVSLLHEWAQTQAEKQCGLTWIKSGKSEIVPREAVISPDARYLRAFLSCGIKLDLWLTTRERWGATYIVRTGSKEFNQWLIARGKRIGCGFEGGGFTVQGAPQAVPEETDVFRFLRLPFIEPQNRSNFAGRLREAA